MDTRILITGTAMGRRFTGITVTEFITRGRTIGIIATGVKRDVRDFETGGWKRPPVYFFGEAELAGAAADEPAGDDSANSFFKRS